MIERVPTGSGRRAVAAAFAGTLVFVAALAWLIAHRTALTMDERHSLLLGQLWASGEVLPFYVGSVTRYEGGSWLIAWPVSWLLRAGAWGTAATSWAAGAISILSVLLSSLWVGRQKGAVAALLVGPLVAAVTPELMHYSYRAWGNLCEALVALPILAFAWESWERRGRSLLGAAGLGLLLAGAIVLSYFHFVTALAFAAVMALEGREEGRFAQAARETGVVAVSAIAGFALWVRLTVPFVGEALSVRDGRSLPSTLTDFLLPRVDRIAVHLPRAFIGELLEPTPVRLAAGILLALAAVYAGAKAFTEGGASRRVAVFAVCYLPALSVGHSLLEAPAVYRYYLPVLAAAVVLLACRPRLGPVALLLGAAFWIPSGLPMPYQNPAATMLELGGNAMHRWTEDPHVKFRALRRHVPTWHRDWFAFGYGVDSGRRYGPTRAGGERILGGVANREALIAEDPHFALQAPEAWTDFWDGLPEPSDRGVYHYGLGLGLFADGRLDALDGELLPTLTPEDRAEVLAGVGAAVLKALEERPGSIRAAAALAPLGAADFEHVGRGMAWSAVGTAPAGARLGLPDGSAAGEALDRGLSAAPIRGRRAMATVPMVPTPQAFEVR